MPNAIRNGRYGRTNGRPRPPCRRRLRAAAPRRPRLGAASVYGAVGEDRLTRSALGDLVAGRLGRMGQTVPERLHERGERLAGDELRHDAIGPDGLVGIGDEVPPLPDLIG